MSFNFATIETIKKLAQTKAQKHDKTLLEEFKKQYMKK